LKLHKKN